MNKLISKERVKEIIAEQGNYKKYTNNPEDYKDFEYLLEAIDTEQASKCFCSECGKEIPTNICHDCWYGQRDCQILELFQKKLDEFNNTEGLHFEILTEEFVNEAKKLKIDKHVESQQARIKELEGLLRDCLKYYSDPDYFLKLQKETVEKMFKIKQALGDMNG
jgi:Fe-S cluster biosynthesis and repair protein YggX